MTYTNPDERGTRTSRAAHTPRAPRAIALTVALTVVVMAAALLLASRIVAPKNNQAEFGQSEAVANGVLGEPRDTLDVLFLGDSEAYCAFSPLQLWHERGITSYVCATSGQKLPYTLEMLDRALDQQRPKVVVLETNCLFRTFTPDVALSSAAERILPVFAYHNRWKSLRAEDFTTAPRATWTDPTKGFRIKTDTAPADDSSYMSPSDQVEPLPISNRWYLELINRTCQDHGATLLLVSTPSTKNWRMKRHNSIRDVAASLGIGYVDLNTGKYAVDIDWQRETCDAGDHLNVYGAHKVTARIGTILRTTYQLPDHASDPTLSAWNDAYARYAKKLAQLS